MPDARPPRRRARRRPEKVAAPAPTSDPDVQPSIVEEVIAGAATSFQIPAGAIVLPAMGWRCRPYQRDAWRYMTENDGRGKLAVLNWHRRAGKDNFLFNLIAHMTTRRKGMYWHAFPELKQGRKAIWEGYTRTGQRILDYLPHDLREDVNQQELRINLKQGSTYMIVGAADPDSNLGAGPIGFGASEYATMNPKMYDLVSPMLSENDGWAIFISTPRGHNHFKRIYDFAAKTPGCFAQTLTVDDTWYIDEETGLRRPVHTKENIARELAMGKSEDWIRQEYFCDWNASVEGAVYAKLIKAAEDEKRICDVPWDPALPVRTAWDLGFRDWTSVIFYQLLPNGMVNVIDYLQDSGQAIKFYCDKIRQKPYRYDIHFGPWDLGHKTIHTGNSTQDIARMNGIIFRKVARHEVEDGIEAARAAFPRLRIDKTRCQPLIDALKAYHRNYDELTKVYTEPVHDWASHPADAFRYLSYSLPRTQQAVLPYHLQQMQQIIQQNKVLSLEDRGGASFFSLN